MSFCKLIVQNSRRDYCDNRATGNSIHSVGKLGANVVVDYHEQNIRYPAQ